MDHNKNFEVHWQDGENEQQLFDDYGYFEPDQHHELQEQNGSGLEAKTEHNDEDVVYQQRQLPLELDEQQQDRQLPPSDVVDSSHRDWQHVYDSALVKPQPQGVQQPKFNKQMVFSQHVHHQQQTQTHHQIHVRVTQHGDTVQHDQHRSVSPVIDRHRHSVRAHI